MDSWPDISTPANGQRRKKPMTYGRAARNTTFTPQSVGSFYDNGSSVPDLTPRPKTLTRPKSLPRRTPLRQPVEKDDFDVPSSDQEPTSAKKLKSSLKHNAPRLAHKSKTDQKRKSPGELPQSKMDQKRKSPDKLPQPKMDQKRKSPGKLPPPKRTRTSSPASPPAHGDNPHLPPSQTSGAVGKLNARRTYRTPAQQSPIKLGISAPARLSTMVDQDSSDDDHRRTSERLNTPPPHPSLRRAASSTTPKQSQLWSQLLCSDPVEHTADNMPGHTSRAHQQHHRIRARITPHPSIDGTIPTSNRLVDRLKQTVHTGSDADDLDSDSDQESRMPGTPPTGPGINNEERDPLLATQDRNQGASASQITYAQQRSYLQAETLEDSLLASLAVPAMPSARPLVAGRRFAQGSKTKPTSTFDAASDSDDSVAVGIRSIHELRAAGSKKRFLDDNAALFGDIKDHALSSRSRRRSALMELATKLFDEPFLHRFIEHGFDRELAGEFCIAYTDIIADAIICSVLVQLSHSDAAGKAVSRLHKAGALDVAIRCLTVAESIDRTVKDRRTNMSKVAQSSLQDFFKSFREASLWGENKPHEITFFLLGLKCFELVVLCLRRQGDRDGILPLGVVDQLVGLLVGFEKSRNLSAEQELALSVLELASSSAALVTTWPADSWSSIVSALPAILCLADKTKAQVLKLCINLTNENARNCGICSQAGAMRAISEQIMEGFRHLHALSDEHERLSRRDTLVLATGLMTNLAEFSDEACEQVVALPDDGLASMVRIFLRGQEQAEEAQSEEETQSNVAYGFLAVLLGNLCQNPIAREEVRACMPEKKLQPLVDAIDEFAHYNQKVDSQAFENEEGRDVWQKFTGKLMAVAARIQQYEG